MKKTKELLKKIRLQEARVSKILGGLVLIVIGFLIFNYFRGLNQPTPKESESSKTREAEEKLVEEEGKLVPAGLPTTYKVKRGDNLWKIAEQFYTSGYNWVDIARENHLTNPHLLYVGQELTLPKTEVIKPPRITSFGPPIEGEKYTVAKGDHLWGIAVRAYGDGHQWVKIAHENKLTNPNLIHPGNVLTLPR